nr:MAG TPA: hypothetical protein [Caudoviricetes sp.]
MVRRPLWLLDGFTRCCRASAQKGRKAHCCLRGSD